MPWSGMFGWRGSRRAVTEMTAAYTPLRDLTVVDEELQVTFVTPERTQFDAWICFAQRNSLLYLWVQDRNLHAEAIQVNEFIWIPITRCTSTNTPAKVLFGRKPLYEGQTCMQFHFTHSVHLELFMRQIAQVCSV